MTVGNEQIVSFGKYFGYFQLYWNYCSQRGNRYNHFEVFVKTAFLFGLLLQKWIENKWSTDELKWICNKIYLKNSLFDPDFFINDKFAYLNHGKNCYFMRNDTF